MSSATPPINERRHIESVPGRCGGRPCIVGHRIRVQDIVEWSAEGQSPDEIVRRFPQLTLGNVHAALAYYFDHREEMDRQIKEDEEYVVKMKALSGPGPLGDID